MRRIKLNISVPRTAVPFRLTIGNFDGDVLFAQTVYSTNISVCMQTCEKDFVITVIPIGGTFYPSRRYLRFGCLDRCAEYEYDLFFPVRAIPAPVLQCFTLTDAFYGFPVECAELNFTTA